MQPQIRFDNTDSLYRVDTFLVPQTARTAFAERLLLIQRFLESQPGCLYNRVIELPQEGDKLRMMTIAEWQDASAMEAARIASRAHYEKIGFSPAVFMTELAVEPDFGVYRTVKGAGTSGT